MKKLLLALLLMAACKITLAQKNIGIGTTTPDTSAVLDISASNKGLLIPRVTAANRPANPATGLMIYQTDSPSGFYYWDGSTWKSLAAGTVTGSGNNGEVTFWTGSGQSGSSNLYWNQSTSSLGINTNNPTAALHVKGNMGIINVEGANQAYMQFYPLGMSSGRKAYLGFGNGGTAFYITNERPGHIILMPGTGNSLGVGIGTTEPVAKLHVAGSAYIKDQLVIDGEGVSEGTMATNDKVLRFGGMYSTTGIASKRTNDGNYWGLDFFTNNLSRMSIDVWGNIGVGTNTPTAKLDVAGGLNVRDNLIVDASGANDGQFTNNCIRFGGFSSTAIASKRTAGGNQSGLDFFTGSSISRMSITSTGNVGIGNTTPTQKLDVTGNIKADNNLVVDGAGTNDGFNYNNTLKFGGILSGSQIGSKRTAGGNENGLDFFTNGVNRVSITNTGNLGIGTSTPATKLDVAGNTNVTGYIIAGTNLVVDGAGTNDGFNYNNTLKFGGIGSGSQIGSKRTAGGNENGLDFFTNGSKRVSITRNGNVGIGIDSPTTKLDILGGINISGSFTMAGNMGIGTTTPTQKLDVTGNTNVSGSIIARDNLTVDANGTNDGLPTNNGLRFGSTGSGTLIASKRTANGNQNGLDFFTATVSRMSITAAGNVGVGTNSPSAKLQVAGGDYKTISAQALDTANTGAGINLNAKNNNGHFTLLATGPYAGVGRGKFGIFDETTGSYRMVIDGTGNVGIGTGAPSVRLEVAGSIKATGLNIPTGAANGYVLTSDANGNASWHALPASRAAVSNSTSHITNGNIITDANGFATVELPNNFEAANKDFRYQLTVIGSFAQAIVKQKVAGNRFIIQTNAPNIEVSWQVTGIGNHTFTNIHTLINDVKQE